MIVQVLASFGFKFALYYFSTEFGANNIHILSLGNSSDIFWGAVIERYK